VTHLLLHDPEPPSVVNGRPFLYDGGITSSNGEASCAACHVFGDFDGLAWDLGNPGGVVVPNPNPFLQAPGLPVILNPVFHPLKGPMTTQTLRGMDGDGPMHWRGDRTDLNTSSGFPEDERKNFITFNVAFDSLLGRGGPLTSTQMGAFADFILQVTPPPNPIRALDNSRTTDESAGMNRFFNGISDAALPCVGCHVTSPIDFGTRGGSTFEGESQEFKVPHFRNLYTKVGMFGMPYVGFAKPGDNGFTGDQVRGFGFLHDGSVDTLFRFANAAVFNLNATERRQVEAFLLAFDSNLAPIVGQQITLTSTNGGAAGPRIDLLIARAAANECDLTVKGTRLGLQRGWLRRANGLFRTDRIAEADVTDVALRAQASAADGERTYTCVPPGSGIRTALDRDEDGLLDRDELDQGTDPADPNSPPPTTSSTTTTTLPPAATLIQTTALKLTDGRPASTDPARSRMKFKSTTSQDPPVNRIIPPAPGSAADPTIAGGTLSVYNTTNLVPFDNDSVTVQLPASGWTVTKAGVYRFRGDVGSPVQKVLLRSNRIAITAGKAGWTYTLDEPFQGRIGVRLQVGAATVWCSNADAKATGHPATTLPNDHPGRFIAQPKTPPPATCPD